VALLPNSICKICVFSAGFSGNAKKAAGGSFFSEEDIISHSERWWFRAYHR
jgi:hypothetical protein